MFPLTDSLLRFRMADELVLYILPCFQGEGSRLFAGSPDPSAWELAGTRCFRGGMSAVCITGGFRTDDYPSAGLSLNVISIL